MITEMSALSVRAPCAHDLTDGDRRGLLSGRRHSSSLHLTLRSQLCVSSALPRGFCQPCFLLTSVLRLSQALLAPAESASLTLIYARLNPPPWLSSWASKQLRKQPFSKSWTRRKISGMKDFCRRHLAQLEERFG